MDLTESSKKLRFVRKNTIERIDSFIIPENAKNLLGKRKRNIIFLHMAVKANERDSETLAGILDSLGFEKI